MKKFLTARWQDVIMANYEVDPAVLKDRVPMGTEIDLHDSKCFVSLVGFMFLDTRVMELLIPFHINFEEVNLRFYVVRETEGEIRRGVVFIKEIVPRAAIATVARTIYGEPYERMPMSHNIDDKAVSYSWQKRGQTNSIKVARGKNIGVPDEGSHREFIIEHYWGYTKRGDRTDEYKVEHPKWELIDVKKPKLDVDFQNTYGEEFAFLNDREPHSVLLAKGSEIAVYRGEKIV